MATSGTQRGGICRHPAPRQIGGYPIEQPAKNLHVRPDDADAGSLRFRFVLPQIAGEFGAARVASSRVDGANAIEELGAHGELP